MDFDDNIWKNDWVKFLWFIVIRFRFFVAAMSQLNRDIVYVKLVKWRARLLIVKSLVFICFLLWDLSSLVIPCFSSSTLIAFWIYAGKPRSTILGQHSLVLINMVTSITRKLKTRSMVSALLSLSLFVCVSVIFVW